MVHLRNVLGRSEVFWCYSAKADITQNSLFLSGVSIVRIGAFLFLRLLMTKLDNISMGIIKTKHLSQITSLKGSYDVAWRKHDVTKYAKQFAVLIYCMYSS